MMLLVGEQTGSYRECYRDGLYYKVGMICNRRCIGWPRKRIGKVWDCSGVRYYSFMGWVCHHHDLCDMHERSDCTFVHFKKSELANM